MLDTGGAATLGPAGCGAAACRGTAAITAGGTEPKEAACGCAAPRGASPGVCGGGEAYGEAYGEADAGAEGVAAYGERWCWRGDGVCAALGGVYVAGGGEGAPLAGLRSCGGCFWANGDKKTAGGGALPDVSWTPLPPFEGGRAMAAAACCEKPAG